MVSFEPNSQLRQFSSSAGSRVVSAPPMVVGTVLTASVTASPSGVPSSSANAAGMAPTSSTAASKSAAARRANIEMCFKMVSSCFQQFLSV